MKKMKILMTMMLITLFFGCATREDKAVEEFITYSKSLDIDKLKMICDENTNFYLRMTIEPLIKLGNSSSIKNIKSISSTLDCIGEGNVRTCSYIDEKGDKQYFEIKLSMGIGKDGYRRVLVNIDKNYFW